MKWRMGARGGAGENLWKTGTLPDYQHFLMLYPTIIQTMVSNDKSKPKNTDNQYTWGEKNICFRHLQENDVWWHERFGNTLKNTGEASKDDMQRMLQWKWSRGKYRPGRTRFTDYNNDDDVRSIVRQTLHVLSPLGGSIQPKEKVVNAVILEAIKCATAMPQIGPASACGILAARYPTYCPMYADEAMESIGMAREPYNAQRYCDYAAQLRRKANALGITANEVCDALFAASKADQLGLPFQQEDKEEGKVDKEEEDKSARPKKKRKKCN